MTPFEKVMESSFAEYLTSNTAYLQFLYPKMKMAGYIGKAPGFVQVAKAPYDIDGYFMDGFPLTIACEVKENGDHHESMSIIPPKKRGTGLQYHQLEALVRVHQAKGMACVVWNNGGEIGFLDGSRLKAAKAAMDTSLKAEAMGMPNGKKGMRSILWGNFVPVKTNGRGVPLWLPPNPWAKTLLTVKKSIDPADLENIVAAGSGDVVRVSHDTFENVEFREVNLPINLEDEYADPDNTNDLQRDSNPRE